MDQHYDVVVLGSGAAGLTAALAAAHSGARVALVEKADKVGGTTALSSAVVWLPANRYGRAAGVTDSREAGLAYLESLSHGLILPELAEAFVDTVDELTDWLEESTPSHFQLVAGFPDYHPEHPGGMPGGGRSIEPRLFSFDALPGWADRVVGTPRRMNVSDTPTGGGTGVIDAEELARREAAGLEGLGRALVGSLLAGCLERGVTVRTGARATRLLTEHGQVTGVEVEADDGPATIGAGAVVLATGGFEYDDDLVRDFLRGPMRRPAGVPTNTGDGLRMAMRLGAALGNMREAWWVPVVELPGERADGGNNVFLILRERTLPGSLIVNDQGRRFTNEAANYNALGGAFHAFDPSSFRYQNQPCWLVFHHGFATRYGCFGNAPGAPVPDFVERADTLAELAVTIGVPPDALEATVRRWNDQVGEGRDSDFGRGDSAYDGWCGDRSRYPGRAATLGALDEAPYYAVPLVSSTLGTKGGPRTDVDGRVLDVDGAVIPGLFAAGNVMAAPTGMVYGGAGGTLGPAMVFGYRAGRAASAVARTAVRAEQAS
ncbi:FAD-dependent oxidoreductase [Nocardioides nitrophenolicus]|uniref:FAD-dependent oxidoreductase n=1 Tax=Nocardioides nitrophenolicus TaxID=60489 RepID=UPI00195AFF6A|nr:FAD-dependent oxidoreductase [Nocardioides nitrophenolicus]MBM7516503.1 succinate dehydrogenase/fumarate reductase flavoprotein subunit [Nocardioides nitrophenolicus]